MLVDDNNRVHKGDLLVQLDPEPFQVQVDIAQAAVTAAQADLVAAQAQARAAEGQMREPAVTASSTPIEDVDNQIARLRSRVATLNRRKRRSPRPRPTTTAYKPLVATGAVTKRISISAQRSDDRRQGQVEEALQGVYQIRVSLGLPPKPETGDDLTQVPADLDQTFSSVRAGAS